MRWWTEHPWRAFWLSQLASVVSFGVAASAQEPLLLLPFVACLLATVVSLFLGVRRVQRGSRLFVGVGGLMAVLFVLGLVMIPMWAGTRSRERMAKAQDDTRTLASAVSMYRAHMGGLPAGLADLNRAVTNARGETAGPFVSAPPSPPSGWSAYTYVTTVHHTFTISASGDGITVTAP